VFAGQMGPNGAALVPEDCDPDAGFWAPYDATCPRLCHAWAGLNEPCQDVEGVFPPSCRPGVHGCEIPDAGGFQRYCLPPHAEDAGCNSFDSCGAGFVCTSATCVEDDRDRGRALRRRQRLPVL
jgi:hypothetical protein